MKSSIKLKYNETLKKLIDRPSELAIVVKIAFYMCEKRGYADAKIFDTKSSAFNNLLTWGLIALEGGAVYLTNKKVVDITLKKKTARLDHSATLLSDVDEFEVPVEELQYYKIAKAFQDMFRSNLEVKKKKKMLNKQNNKPVKQGSQVATFKTFSTTYNPSTFLRDFKHVNTVADALKIDAPSIAKAKKVCGANKIEAYLKLWFIRLNASLDLRKPLTELQIDDCAMLLVDNFYSLNMVDVSLVMKRAIMGYYGELYDSLGTNKIMKWFRDYFDEKCEVAAIISQREHDKLKYHQEKSSRTSMNYIGHMGKFVEQKILRDNEQKQKARSNERHEKSSSQKDNKRQP